MKRRLPHPLALALAALALLPASASAKEIVKAEVCGADGCVSVGPTVAMDLADGSLPIDPPKEAAPFYTAALTVREEEGAGTFNWTITFVPKLGLMRGNDGDWMDAPAQTEAAFARATRNLGAAFPAAELGPLPQPAEANVVEVVRPPAEPAPVDDGGSTWLIAALGLGALVATWALALYVRRRRGAGGTTPAAPTPPGG
jgi:hypothetical protein